MKTTIGKLTRLLLFSIVFFWTSGILNAQCSEAENPTMKKYAELTRNSANTQSCSACAWLANLFCIAENGLYKNDKSEVQKTINNTKETIKLMGDPICCPELLTKSIQWSQGTNQKENFANTSGNQTTTEIEVQQFMNEISDAVNTMQNLNTLNKSGEQLQMDLEKVEMLIQEISTMSDREYQSEEEINEEYNLKLANLNNLAEIHLDLKTKIRDLGYSAAGELLSNQNSIGLGVLATVGAVASTDVKDSKAFTENAKNLLKNSKSEKIFALQYKDVDFQLDLIENKMNEFFSKTYPEDYSNFISNNLIQGYQQGMKYGDFKKLFPKFKWKNIEPNLWQIKNYGGDSNVYFRLGKKNIISSVEQRSYYTDTFSPEKLKEYQQKILEEIRLFDNLFNIKPSTYSFHKKSEQIEHILNTQQSDFINIVKKNNPELSEEDIIAELKKIDKMYGNSNPINSTTSVVWTDQINKSFILNAELEVKDNIIKLEIRKTENNLQSPN